jgi:hypothetical protein
MDWLSVGKSGNISTLADFIHGYGGLPTAFEPFDIGIAFLGMFLADAAIDPFTPQVEAASLQFTAHDGNDFRFGQVELELNGLERGAIFPSHFDDAVEVLRNHFVRKFKLICVIL